MVLPSSSNLSSPTLVLSYFSCDAMYSNAVGCYVKYTHYAFQGLAAMVLLMHLKEHIACSGTINARCAAGNGYHRYKRGVGCPEGSDLNPPEKWQPDLKICFLLSGPISLPGTQTWQVVVRMTGNMSE